MLRTPIQAVIYLVIPKERELSFQPFLGDFIHKRKVYG